MTRALPLLALLVGCAAPCTVPPSVMELVGPRASGSGVVLPNGEIATACHVALHAPLRVQDADGRFRGVAINPRCSPGYVPDPTSITPDVARLEVRWEGQPPPSAPVRPMRVGIAVTVDGLVEAGMSGAAVMDEVGELVGIVSRGERGGRWAWVEQLTLPLTIHGYPNRTCTSLAAVAVAAPP